MGVSAQVFQSAGRRSTHYIPGAYSRIDTTQTSVGAPAATNTVIIGRSTGGEPQTLLQFNQRSDAVRTLRGGPLMDAVRLAFNPGDDIIPQRLFAVRVNNASKASHDLNDASANHQITVKSKDWGRWTNRIRVEMEAGSETGRRFRVYFRDDDEDFDNIERKSLTFTPPASETVTVTNTEDTQTITGGEGSTGDFELDLNEYSTIADVVAAIDAVDGWSASAEPGQDDASSLELDAVEDASTDLFSNVQALIDEVTTNSLYVDLELETSATYGPTMPENFTETALSGGAEGDYDSSQLSTVLTMLEKENIQFIATPDGDQSFMNSIKEHCVTMSSVTRKKERQFLVGSKWGDSLDTSLSNARTLDSRAGGLFVHGGGTQFDSNGKIQEYGGSYAACMLAGMNAALAVQEPLTSKRLGFLKVESKLGDSEQEQLIAGGVCPVTLDEEELPTCIRQITTFQGDDLRFNEFSAVKVMNFVSRDLRNWFKQLHVGTATGTATASLVRSGIGQRLNSRGEDGLLIDAGQGFYRNLQVTLTQDSVVIAYEAYIPLPLNFGFITNHFQVVEELAA